MALRPVDWQRKRRLARVFALVAVVSAACGSRSGTWEDDPRNWARAFDAAQPKAVTVVHSKYWRSPHWSLEFRYFFQLKAEAEFRREYLDRNELVQLPASGVAASIGDRRDVPAWFCPKAPEAYDGWARRDPADGRFRALIDRESGDLYLTDEQL